MPRWLCADRTEIQPSVRAEQAGRGGRGIARLTARDAGTARGTTGWSEAPQAASRPTEPSDVRGERPDRRVASREPFPSHAIRRPPLSRRSRNESSARTASSASAPSGAGRAIRVPMVRRTAAWSRHDNRPQPAFSPCDEPWWRSRCGSVRPFLAPHRCARHPLSAFTRPRSLAS